MHTNRVYTIFWQPSSLPSEVKPFSTTPITYEEAVNSYFEDVAHDSGRFSNVYSVPTQYYSGAENHITYATSFGASVVDTEAFPASSCTDREVPESVKALKVCLSASQLENEIEKVVIAQHWPAGMGNMFFIYTPQGVGGCFRAGESSEEPTSSCAYTGNGGYCAYHSNFPDTKGEDKGEEVIFANMPYGATPSCDNGARPRESDAGPAIDTSSHEHNEAITDPTGRGWWDGNTKEAEEAEPRSNADYEQEIGDLCILQTAALTYGPLLGGTEYEKPGAFNQVIDGRDYLLQREWSNAAENKRGGCVQLLAAPLPPAEEVTTSTSSTTTSSTPPASTTTSSTPPATTTTSPPPPATGQTLAISPPARLSSVELAAALGLPGSGTPSMSTGAIALGHASCPPACSLTLTLYATVQASRHRHRVSRRLLVGSARILVASGATAPIAVKLNAAGGALLRHSRRLVVQLVVLASDLRGAATQVTRTLTLTAPRRTAHRHR